MDTHSLAFWTVFAAGILLPMWLSAGEPAADGYDFGSAYRRILDEMARDPTARSVACLQAARVARRAEELENAERFLTMAARRAAADDGAVAFERLLLRAQRGHVTEMRPKLADHLASEGTDAELAWEALGRGYLRAYRLREARDCFCELLRIRAESVPGLLGRAETDRQWPQHPWGPNPARAAVPDLRRAVALAPWQMTARLRLAEGLSALDLKPELLEAETHLRTVLKERPLDPEGRTLLARVLLKQDRSEEGQSLLKEVVTDFPKYVPALRSLVMLAHNASDEATSFRWARQALEADPYDRTSLFRAGLHLRELAEWQDEAKSLLDRFGEVRDAENELIILKQRMIGSFGNGDPSDPSLRFEAGRVALRLGRRDEARLWFERALLENPDYEPARTLLQGLLVPVKPN